MGEKRVTLSKSHPAAAAEAEFNPVNAQVRPNTFITDEPCPPAYTLGLPQMLSAAILPCLLAGPASENSASAPVTIFFICTASPTA